LGTSKAVVVVLRDLVGSVERLGTRKQTVRFFSSPIFLIFLFKNSFLDPSVEVALGMILIFFLENGVRVGNFGQFAGFFFLGIFVPVLSPLYMVFSGATMLAALGKKKKKKITC
jgi:hypothetical protein